MIREHHRMASVTSVNDNVALSSLGSVPTVLETWYIQLPTPWLIVDTVISHSNGMNEVFCILILQSSLRVRQSITIDEATTKSPSSATDVYW